MSSALIITNNLHNKPISEAARGLHPWNTGGGESLEN